MAESNSLRNYWPYDEVKMEGDCSSGCFRFSTPWLSVDVQIDEKDIPRATPLVRKISSETLAPNDLADVTWLFSSLKQHPLSYILPRAQFDSSLDLHEVTQDRSWNSSTPPDQLLQKLFQMPSDPLSRTQGNLPLGLISEWKWDADAALAFSQVPLGHDPMSLFSIARRFHLLESVENNKTGELFTFLQSLDSDSEQLKRSLIRVVRQNHYVTQKCDSALRPALQTAKGAQKEVQKFIQAEAGHDVLLARALKSMGVSDSTEIPVLEPVLTLMELFKTTARRNFLGFCMVVDIFERSSDQEQDPLAALLNQGGFSKAAEQITLHREINDAGEHENVALHFLDRMAPVGPEYAIEALHLAELATALIHLISYRLLRECQT